MAEFVETESPKHTEREILDAEETMHDPLTDTEEAIMDSSPNLAGPATLSPCLRTVALATYKVPQTLMESAIFAKDRRLRLELSETSLDTLTMP
jgi:hypothetical protein